MTSVAWRRSLSVVIASAIVAGTLGAPAAFGEAPSDDAEPGRLAAAAVVAKRAVAPVESTAPMSSALVYQPQSDWALITVQEDPLASLDAAVDLSQPVKVHTPLADRRASNLDLLPGEPAQEILDLMESSGGSVLQGTLFHDDADEINEQERSTIVQTIRQLQQDDEQQAAQEAPAQRYPAETLACWTTPLAPQPYRDPGPSAPQVSSIEQMRGVCDQLDQAASDLERQGQYRYADRLRETAQEMRLEARRMSETVLPARLEPTAAVWGLRDADLDSRDAELRSLRDEIDSLRQQLQSRPAASPVSYPS